MTCVSPVPMLCVLWEKTRTDSQSPLLLPTTLEAKCCAQAAHLDLWGTEGDPPLEKSTMKLKLQLSAELLWTSQCLAVSLLAEVPSSVFLGGVLPCGSSVFAGRTPPAVASGGLSPSPRVCYKIMISPLVAEQSYRVIEKSHYSYQILQNGSINIGGNPILCYFCGEV